MNMREGPIRWKSGITGSAWQRRECPDHTCVEMGWLNSETPIVCLPNHLLIRFAKHSGEVDSVAG